MTVVAPTSLHKLIGEARVNPFPKHLLRGSKTALLLYAAGFHGRQDGVFVAEAGVQATCVDIDRQKLSEMEQVYPGDWDFIVDDALHYARSAWTNFSFVSVDCPSDKSDMCYRELHTFLTIAARALILTVHEEMEEKSWRHPEIPGWRSTTLRRSWYRGGTYWLCLERE